MSAPRQRLSAPVRLVITAVVTGAVAALVVRIPEVTTWTGKDLIALAALIAGTAVAEQFPIEIRHRSEAMYLALTDSLWAAAILLARPSVLMLGVAAGVGIGLVIRRKPVAKVLFNVGQYLVALALGQLIFSSIAGAGDPLAPRAWVGLVLGMSAYAAASSILVSSVVALSGQRRFRDILLPPLRASSMHYLGNMTLGILGAVAWTVTPFGLILVVFPLIGFYLAYRTLVRSLREGDRLRELIVENASDGIFVAAPDCTLVSWNPAMERITGLSVQEVLGRRWQEVLADPNANGDGRNRGVAGCDGPSETWFATISRRGGGEGWVLCSSSPIADPEGKVKATVVVVHDVTAEREAEQLKADFVATISHELRTPLTPLKGFLTSLIQGVIDDGTEVRLDYYRIMLRQANRLERLVSDLLEVSRIESSDVVADTHPVDLCGPVAEQIRTFAEEHPGRNIVFEAHDGPLLVEAEGSRIGLVVSNLISNATKYSPADTPVVVGVSFDDFMATVSVHDQGPGIPAAEQERIFERFYQIDGTLTREKGGVGLGLYVCRRLVEAMSGRLWVDSRPGSGSTFCFSLPLATSRTSSHANRVTRID
jgi:PAS domain S-box-containing protein